MTAQAWISRFPPNCGRTCSAGASARRGAGVAGTALCAGGHLSCSPFQFYRSYLWSYLFVAGPGVSVRWHG